MCKLWKKEEAEALISGLYKPLKSVTEYLIPQVLIEKYKIRNNETLNEPFYQYSVNYNVL